MLIRVSAIAILCVVTGIMVKYTKNEFSFAIKATGTVLVFGMLLIYAENIIDDLEGLTAFSGVSEYALIMLKTLGVALLTHVTAGICKDCGEGGIADGVELAGKLEILILSIPLIRKILEYAVELISME